MPTTVNDCLVLAISQLKQIESGERIARILLAETLGHHDAWLWAHSDETVPDKSRLQFEGLVTRAKSHEPLAYLLGYAEFYGRRFEVNPSALIPRPETEQLVELVLKSARGNNAFPIRHPKLASGSVNRQHWTLIRVQDDVPDSYPLPATPYTIVDVGAGCGCIALTLAKELPQASVYALDISPEALETAQRNAWQLGISNVTFLQGNLLQPLQRVLEPHSVDAMVANLPYISDDEFGNLPANVRDFEPVLALKSGSSDPDRLNNLLVKESKAWLKPGGLLAYETTNGMIINIDSR